MTVVEKETNISAKVKEKLNIIIFPLLSTARHAQRTHLRQPANYPDRCLLPSTSQHGYVDQNQPRVTTQEFSR